MGDKFEIVLHQNIDNSCYYTQNKQPKSEKLSFVNVFCFLHFGFYVTPRHFRKTVIQGNIGLFLLLYNVNCLYIAISDDLTQVSTICLEVSNDFLYFGFCVNPGHLILSISGLNWA